MKLTYIKTNKIKPEDNNYEIILSNYCGTFFHELLGHNLEKSINDSFNLNLYKINKFFSKTLLFRLFI